MCGRNGGVDVGEGVSNHARRRGGMGGGSNKRAWDDLEHKHRARGPIGWVSRPHPFDVPAARPGDAPKLSVQLVKFAPFGGLGLVGGTLRPKKMGNTPP